MKLPAKQALSVCSLTLHSTDGTGFKIYVGPPLICRKSKHLRWNVSQFLMPAPIAHLPHSLPTASMSHSRSVTPFWFLVISDTGPLPMTLFLFCLITFLDTTHSIPSVSPSKLSTLCKLFPTFVDLIYLTVSEALPGLCPLSLPYVWHSHSLSSANIKGCVV